MRKKQRLVVCLDGTWNTKDSSTNVVHHFALAIERPWPDANADCTQTRYYDEGVGTGVLEGITGGAFGFGLEENVRAAYDWLVEHFHDKDESADADEIYIFGFSRGAYTARSLVGFIGTFGLLRRGAPLSVNQLWREYCLLGRERDHRTSVWDQIFGAAPVNTRRINDLIVDPWNIERFEERRRHRNVEIAPDRVPGQLADDLNAAERLLVRWSRRVRITYLGIYDTVGALGIDALAIPGVKSRLAMHHNLHATTLVQHCRHALALDENRRSFNHTPLVEFIGHGEEEDSQCSAMKEDAAATYWKRSHAMWRRKIEQRWFAGSHSNIGGGYPDNELAQLPFKWLLEGAQQIGLECEGISLGTPAMMPKPRDSYAEFAKPFWTEVIRGKRNYRQIDPERDVRASSRKSGDNNDPTVNCDLPAGFSLQSINEQVDPTALEWAATQPDYQPPNLQEYARRKLEENTAPADSQTLRLIAERRPPHPWLGTARTPYLIVALWATFVSVGFAALNMLFTAWRELPPCWVLSMTAFAFVLVDWIESRSNFRLAAERRCARRRALFDSIYWVRTLGFVLFVFGSLTALGSLWGMGWYAESFRDARINALAIIQDWWPVTFAAAVGVLLANAVERTSRRRQISGLIGSLIAGPLVAIGIVLLVILLARLCGYVFTPAFGHPQAMRLPSATEAQLAGLLLLLQLGAVYLLNAFRWVGEPTRRANLGSIMPLQPCLTPSAVSQCFEQWRMMLACRWDKADEDAKDGPAAKALREILREALWRDIFGFIPLYTAVCLFGLWFAAEQLEWERLGREFLHLPLWLWLPLAAAIADWMEDACHLRYVTLHERGKPPPMFLTVFSVVMTVVKFLAFGIAFFLTVGALLMGTLRVMELEQETGWRGTAALAVSTAALLFIVAVVFGAVIYRIRTQCRKRIRCAANQNTKAKATEVVG